MTENRATFSPLDRCSEPGARRAAETDSAAHKRPDIKLRVMVCGLWRSFVAALYAPVGWSRARFLVRHIAPHLVGRTVLDLGAGTGHTAVLLRKRGGRVTMLDVAPHKGALGQWLVGQPIAALLARRHNIPRVRYDGRRIPFENDSFDCVLIAFALHHCENPGEVLREATRVCKVRVLVLEDVNGEQGASRVERFVDALWNLELFHPHQERTSSEWLSLFDACDLRPIFETKWTWKLLLNVPQTLWALEKRAPSGSKPPSDEVNGWRND